MPQADMHIHVSCPDWSTLSDPEKSLVNFFLKDSKMYFEGAFTGSTLDALYGCIRTTYRTLIETYGDSDYFADPSSIELYIPYTVDTSASPATYPVVAESCIPEFPLTLVEKESRLRLYWVENNNSLGKVAANVYHSNSSTVESILPIENIRVVLTPKIGTSTSSNPDVSISAITSVSPLLSRGITSESGFDSDYQLRTSSLYLDDGNGNVTENVFYRIGIVPFTKQYNKSGEGASSNTPSTVESIKTFLLNKSLNISTGNSYVANSGYQFYIGNVDFTCGSLEDNNPPSSYCGGKVPLSFIVPIMTDDYEYVPTGKFIGLVYARLCKQNGDEINPADVLGYNLKLYYKSSEDDPNPEEIEYSFGKESQEMTITDQSLSGGWIQSPAGT